jgi:hypothetical protein
MDENPIVPTEATIPEEELDLELELGDDSEEEDIAAIKAKAEKMETFARQAVARAKKAEEENKSLKKTPLQPQPASPTNVEETVLLANGMSEELLEELKAIAQVRKTSLIKAQADPIFVAIKEKIEKDKKQQEASLPASRGSGSAKPKKDFKTVGLTRDDHMALFNSALQK